MKRFLVGFTILMLSLPSVGFAACSSDLSSADYCNQADRASDAADANNSSSANYTNSADRQSDAATAAWQSSPSGPSTPTGTSAPASGTCNFDPNDNQGPGAISAALKGCKPTRGVIETKGDYKIESGVRSRIVDVANNLIYVGSILAVGAIVYAAILYTIAAGDDERIKSAKNALKFGIIGFVVMLISFGLVNAIVQLFYATGV